MMKVKLLKAHTHGGVKYDEGMELDVSETDANWLKNLKIAVDANSKTTANKTDEEK